MDEPEDFNHIRHAVRTGLADVSYAGSSPADPKRALLDGPERKVAAPRVARVVVGAALLVALVLAVPLVVGGADRPDDAVASGRIDGWVVTAFLGNNTTDADIDGMYALVRELHPTAPAQYYRVDEMMMEGRHRLRGNESALQILDEDPDLLPPVMRVVVESREEGEALAGVLRARFWMVEQTEVGRPGELLLVPKTPPTSD